MKTKLQPLIIFIALCAAAGCSGVESVRKGLNEPEWNKRFIAADELKTLPVNDDTIELFFKALDDPAPRVRARAATVLAQYDDQKALKPIYDQALEKPERVQEALLRALSKRPNDSSQEFLRAAMKSENRDLRLRAMQAYGKQWGAETPDPLLTVWRDEKSEFVRAAALVYASYPADKAKKKPEVLECYDWILKNDPQMMRNPYVISAVGNLGIKAAEDDLLELVDDPELKYVAIESLGKLKSEKAIPVLLKILDEDKSWVMCRTVCKALAVIRKPELGPELAKRFLDSKPEESRDAWDRTLFLMKAMTAIGGDDVFEAMVSQITDENKRDFALTGLYTLTETHVVNPMNYWMYSWEGIQQKWREWWPDHKAEVAERLKKEAREEAEQP